MSNKMLLEMPFFNSTSPLTPAQLESFNRFGWVSVPRFFDVATTSEIIQWTDEVTAMPEVPGRNMIYREPSLIDSENRIIQRIENFCPNHVGFDTLCRSGRLVEAVSQVLGGEACLFKDKINLKMAGGAGFEPHQDQQAGWSRYAPLFVTALICIDSATTENGCLEMATLPRLNELIAPEWQPITPEEMSGFELFPVPTEPGDVLLFDSYAPHASKPNMTKSQRRLLYLTYNLRSDGDHRLEYFHDKRMSFPPDIERDPAKTYKFRV